MLSLWIIGRAANFFIQPIVSHVMLLTFIGERKNWLSTWLA